MVLPGVEGLFSATNGVVFEGMLLIKESLARSQRVGSKGKKQHFFTSKIAAIFGSGGPL